MTPTQKYSNEDTNQKVMNDFLEKYVLKTENPTLIHDLLWKYEKHIERIRIYEQGLKHAQKELAVWELEATHFGEIEKK